jgi:hypothetical protein
MKRFTRTIEDFVCGNCRREVKGDGYTNHCPECLWCRHVDINPGDRAEKCNGMMEPVSIEVSGGEGVITHICANCRFERKNKVNKNDNEQVVIDLSTN